MKLPWSRTESPSLPLGVPGVEASTPGTQTCRSLQRVLERLESVDHAQALDLGPVCGDSVVFLAAQGARVTVDSFDPPAAVDPDDGAEVPPIRIPFDDEQFDLILAWEWVDFVPRDRLADFAAEIHRLLRPGGQLLIFSHNDSKGAGRGTPPRYRVVETDKVMRESSGGEPRRRYVHATRLLEDALKPLSIQGVQLQRNQMREILASRKRPRAVAKASASSQGPAAPRR